MPLPLIVEAAPFSDPLRIEHTQLVNGSIIYVRSALHVEPSGRYLVKYFLTNIRKNDTARR